MGAETDIKGRGKMNHLRMNRKTRVEPEVTGWVVERDDGVGRVS